MPRYQFETVTPDLNNPGNQLLLLSERVRRHQLFGFIEIAATSVEWYSNESGFGEMQRWLAGPVNDALRRIHLSELGLNAKQLDGALRTLPIESMNLVAKDDRTGQIVPARKRGITEGFAAPFALAILFFMIVLLTSTPMLAAVAEDKCSGL